MNASSLLWRRLDTPGHDACRFERLESGWQLDGTAVFRHNGAPAQLSYRVGGDAAWRTRLGLVRGFVGTDVVDVTIKRTADGTWAVNDQIAPGLESLVHLDFGFTPATNFPQVRGLSQAAGHAVDLPVAWLDVPFSGLQVLPQRYERRSDTAVWYEAPSVGYAALLELTPEGFVRRYPGLWELED